MPQRLIRAATAAAICIASSTASHATLAGDDGTVIVTASRIATPERDATFATEIHTRRQIEASGATSLFDYLSRHSSLQIAPSFGNREAPKIDLRGYGIENGNQNLVITVDGRRLNAVDLATPLLGGVAIDDIERVEITKGSGAVLFGDGAMAGTIQIHTRRDAGGSLGAYAGNYGAMGAAAVTTQRSGALSLSASATRKRFDGTGAPDPAGHRDATHSDTWRLAGEAAAGDRILLRAAAGEARVDTRYVNALTQAQFTDRPQQGSGALYNHQLLSSEHRQAGGDFQLGERVRLSVDHRREDRRSEFVAPFPFAADYDHRDDELTLHYEGDALRALVGAQLRQGERIGAFDTTGKESTAAFGQLRWQAGSLALTAGVRREKIDYRFTPGFGAVLADSHRLSAWDAGVNLRVDERTSVFANHAYAFQAPDIDRFFSFDFGLFQQVFNAFIAPARSRTTTVGAHHTLPAGRLKLAAFHADLKNEIYFFDTGSFLTSFNTNIDESHKYGVELQGDWQAAEAVTSGFNYAYTRAVIDRENEGGGAFDGKDLPGVSRHSLSATASWRASPRTTLSATHSWRSSAWAASDFANAGAQRQRAWISTQLSARYRLRDDLDLQLAVDNLFERKNGLWVADDVVYPVEFARTWRIGAKAAF
jgi:iron complex outermembrane receptor protein